MQNQLLLPQSPLAQGLSSIIISTGRILSSQKIRGKAVKITSVGGALLKTGCEEKVPPAWEGDASAVLACLSIYHAFLWIFLKD